MAETGHLRRFERPPKMSALPPIATEGDNSWDDEKCHVWTTPAVQEENLTFQRVGSGAAMYTAFECSRCGRWPWC